MIVNMLLTHLVSVHNLSVTPSHGEPYFVNDSLVVTCRMGVNSQHNDVSYNYSIVWRGPNMEIQNSTAGISTTGNLVNIKTYEVQIIFPELTFDHLGQYTCNASIFPSTPSLFIVPYTSISEFQINLGE